MLQHRSCRQQHSSSVRYLGSEFEAKAGAQRAAKQGRLQCFRLPRVKSTTIRLALAKQQREGCSGLRNGTSRLLKAIYVALYKGKCSYENLKEGHESDVGTYLASMLRPF